MNPAVLDQFTGKRIAFPDGRYMGECTAVAVWYLQLNHIPVPAAMYGQRGDGWGMQFPASLVPYFTHEAYQPGKAYPAGTILMWNSPHIAVSLAVPNGNTVKVFEQNADPDGFPCQAYNRLINTAARQCTYALVPIVKQVSQPQEVVEMIANDTQAHQMYQLLRPNGDGSTSEITETAGHRTFAEFLNAAQPEMSWRNAVLSGQAQSVATLQAEVNSLTVQVTNLNLDDTAKTQQLQDALAKVTALTTELAKPVNQLVAKPIVVKPVVSVTSPTTNRLISFLKWFSEKQ